MHRTTISLQEELFERLKLLAEQENRSTPNLIETILLRYLDEDLYVNEFEMAALQQDEGLKKSIRRGIRDYEAGRGRFV